MGRTAQWARDAVAIEARTARRTRPLRVLVAEDEPDIRQIVAFALRGRGYEVIEACTGAELLDALADTFLFGNRERKPDIIVSDIRMPGFTGLEILAGLRDAEWPIAVVLMSAFADADTRAEAIRLGVEAFFEKPFEIDDLVRAVVDIPRFSRQSRGRAH